MSNLKKGRVALSIFKGQGPQEDGNQVIVGVLSAVFQLYETRLRLLVISDRIQVLTYILEPIKEGTALHAYSHIRGAVVAMC